LQLALGDGGKATDPQGAFRLLATHGWRRALLVLLVCGFVADALWRLAQPLFNRGGHGEDPAGYGRRLIQLCQALIYIGFAVSAVRILAGAGGSARGERHAVGGMLSWPGLAVVLALIGWFLLKAAVDYDANRIVSLGGALAKLAHATYGKWLLGLVAAGLLSYGLFGILQVPYHRV
jgi:Domain of Unknown Function (DUF1206)